jgi:molybdopterin-binding protein
MKSYSAIKKKTILILLFALICTFNIYSSMNLSKKNFLKNNIEKNLKSKTETKVEATVEVQKSLVENSSSAELKLKEKAEEEQYELQRANAMAELIF